MSRRKKRDLHYSSANIRFHVGDLFQNFSCLGSYIYAKGNTQLETRVMNYRQNLQIRFPLKIKE